MSFSRIVPGAALFVASVFGLLAAAPAQATYWNVFNVEGESAISASFVTYATLSDMLHDTNRLSSVTANGYSPYGANIVGSGSDGSTYWNVFNVEGESAISASFVTYATLDDMLHDSNRLTSVTANGYSPYGANIVGSGSDGSTYWNLFNVEGESAISASFVTYATLDDMLHDSNRLTSVTANGYSPYGANIVGSGSDGSTYWNVFNVEGESAISASFVTYATLDDMLHDTNRLTSVTANGYSPYGANIVGSGSDSFPAPPPPAVPEPATWAMMLAGAALTGGALRRRRNTGARLITA